MVWIPIFVIPLFIALVIVAIVVGARAKRKRQQALGALAQQLRCRFHTDDPYDLADRFESSFETLRTGSRRYAYNVISGAWQDRDLRIFDHHYETYSHNKNGRQTHHHHRTFVLVEHDVDMGQLDVRPEGMFDKLKAAFGFDDIDFESDEFSRSWHVRAADRKFAYDLFHPKMMEYFQTLPGFKLTTSGAWGLYRIGSGRMKAAEIRRTLSSIDGMIDRIPRFVRKDRAL